MINTPRLLQITNYYFQNGEEETLLKFDVSVDTLGRYIREFKRREKEGEFESINESAEDDVRVIEDSSVYDYVTSIVEDDTDDTDDIEEDGKVSADIGDIIDADKKIGRLTRELKDYKSRYNKLLEEVENNDDLSFVLDMYKKHSVETIDITPSTEKHESTAVMVLSDVHIEENVDEEVVSFLNSYNVDICTERLNNFFTRGLRLVEIQRHGTTINNLVLALLGDMISGYIHEELQESNELSPIQAVLKIHDLLIAGIDYLKANGKFKSIDIVCADGNHGRTTQKIRHSTRYKNSFEFLLYSFIARHYSNDPIVNIHIGKSYHVYMNIYGYTLRFHHGDGMRYGGGVGGITIPVNKAIASWNVGRKAEYDVFGHFHTFFDGGNFISNGSVIGYNAFSMSIKAKFEKPKQAFFLIDKKYGKTIVSPIIL